MNKEKIKSSELVIIKKILAWQVAQTLGREDEETLKNHALLLAVDFEDDTLFPLMVGDDFSLFTTDDDSDTWTARYTYIVNSYFEGDHEEALRFFSADEAKAKWAKNVEFDAFNFVSIIHDSPKWTHCVEHLFERDGRLQAIFWFVEIDRFHKNQNAMSFLAEHDALTGLYNRHHLNMVEKELGTKQGPRDDVFYVFVDLDDFKQVNDTHGHSNGDIALIALSEKLEKVFFHKATNIVFRLGGDEFLVIVLNTPEEKLVSAIKEMNQPIFVRFEDGTSTTLNTSIGYAHDIKAADEALYKVKSSGKHSFAKGK